MSNERTCNKCGSIKPLEHFPEAKGCRLGRRPTCKSCMAAKTKAWREADPQRSKESIKACKERNLERWYEKERKRTQKYKQTHKEKVREAGRAYNTRNPHIAQAAYQRNREVVKARAKQWVQNNRDRFRIASLIRVNRRRAEKVQATPPWADLDAIKRIYKACYLVNKATGRKFEVDHIVPLKGKLVCGLHVENNLQVIPRSNNRAKLNKFNVE